MISVRAAAVTLPTAQSQIESQYRRAAKATLTNDVDTLLSILTPDYVLLTYTGTLLDRKTYEASLRKRHSENQHPDTYKTRIVTIHALQKFAKVISEETSSKVSRDPLTDRNLRVIQIHRYVDTWIKVGQTWQLKATATLEESTKVETVK